MSPLLEADYKSFLKVYKAIERGLTPSYADVFDCALLLKEYFEDYVQWYDDKIAQGIAIHKDDAKILPSFRLRLAELINAIKSKDLQKLLTAVDQGINQWHVDYPVIAHLQMQVGDDEDLSDAMHQVSDILARLGRLPLDNPYFPLRDNKLSIIINALIEDRTSRLQGLKKRQTSGQLKVSDEDIERALDLSETYADWLLVQVSKGLLDLSNVSIKQVLSDFDKLKQSAKFKSSKDIFQYKSFHDLEQTVLDAKETQMPKKTIARQAKAEGQRIVAKEGPYEVVEVTTTEAASEVFRGTVWCVKDPDYSEGYLEKGPLYLVKKNGKKFLCYSDEDGFNDIKNDEVKFIDDTLYAIFKRLGTNVPEFAFSKEEVVKDPQLAYEYARDIIKGRWPEGEGVIAKDPKRAYYYAKDIIKGRWSKGEEAIAKDPKWAYEYVKNIIKGRWPEGEETIAKDSYYAYLYAYYIIKGRWPEGEEAIIKNPAWAHYYAFNIIKGRWPEGEKAIAKDPKLVYQYALIVIKGRWPEGEEAIIKNPQLAYQYARDIIKGRWPEGEEVIAKNPEYAYFYARDVIKDRFPEGEEAIAEDPWFKYYYAKDVIKGPWRGYNL